MADEFAGSDGDIVTAAVKLLGLGPVVGTRTWGGVIGIEGRQGLVDGTTITVPRFAFFFDEYGWGVENHGVDPDVEVLITPNDAAAGRDPQLETAVQLALDALDKQPLAVPPEVATGPVKSRPPLPPRESRTGSLTPHPPFTPTARETDDRRSCSAASAPDPGAHGHVLRRGRRADGRRDLQGAGARQAARPPAGQAAATGWSRWTSPSTPGPPSASAPPTPRSSP